jgi:hypothetical protein
VDVGTELESGGGGACDTEPELNSSGGGGACGSEPELSESGGGGSKP